MKKFFIAAFVAATALSLCSCEKDMLAIHGYPEQETPFDLTDPLPTDTTSTVTVPDTVFVIVTPQPQQPQEPAAPSEPSVRATSFSLFVKAQTGTVLSSVCVDINGAATRTSVEKALGLDPVGVYEFEVQDLQSDNVVVDLDYRCSYDTRFSFILSDYSALLQKDGRYAILVDLTTGDVSITVKH